MDNEHLENENSVPQEGYTPRPAWQRVAAWIGIAVMVVSIILYYWHIASGGMLG